MLKLSVIIFRNNEGKILLQFRDSNAPSQALAWSFFGGTAEDNESPMDTLIREVDEELGLQVSSANTRLLAERHWISPNSGKEKMVYLYEGISVLDWADFVVREGAGAAFLTKDEILTIKNVSLLARTFIADYC
jgi:8-oxo-dGTP pyrophosphatase MutT (NUDIX family)